MQQQIAELERQLANVSESLDAMVQQSQALSGAWATLGKRQPTVQKVPAGAGRFKLVLRPSGRRAAGPAGASSSG